MIHGLSLGDILLHTFFLTVEGYLASPSTHVAIVGIGHLARSVDNTTHDAYLQSHKVTGGCFDAADSVL